MTETTTLGLPLVAAAQAQKHVTVNEALSRLDALVQMTLTTRGATTPPSLPGEGTLHAVGNGAGGDWVGQDGRLALWLNNGWVFLDPKAGWRAWSVEDGGVLTFDGSDWIAGGVALSENGAATVSRVVELVHAVGTGSTSVVTGALPDGALILGVSARVIGAVGGASGFDIGVAGDADRFAAGVGVVSGAVAASVRGVPGVYPGGGDIVLTATGGSFDGTGQVRLAIHLSEIRAPRG